MDGNTGRPDGTGSYIWLRYATQFKVGDRVHTIEMGVPVPIGASAEMRERLLREALAGSCPGIGARRLPWLYGQAG